MEENKNAVLSFDTGIKTFEINGGETVRFNPTDSFFVERLFDTFTDLDKKQEEYKREVAAVKDNREIFEIARKRDREMREMIDGIFGAQGLSDGVFGGVNVYALADGLPIWCNFLMAVMDQVDTSFAQEQKRANPRLQKYIARYQKNK